MNVEEVEKLSVGDRLWTMLPDAHGPHRPYWEGKHQPQEVLFLSKRLEQGDRKKKEDPVVVRYVDVALIKDGSIMVVEPTEIFHKRDEAIMSVIQELQVHASNVNGEIVRLNSLR
jgi:hypothetical protein